MKKLIVVVSCLLFLFPVFAVEQNFQERLYCKFADNSVRVYLLKEDDTTRCNDYVAVVNVYLKKEYDSIIQIMANRNRWDDIEYWDSLYEEKKAQFLKLFSQRMMIQWAMNKFEEELLERCKELMWETLEMRNKELDDQIVVLENELRENAYNIRVAKALQELKNKKQIVEKMITANEMTSFLEAFSVYLTLYPFAQIWK